MSKQQLLEDINADTSEKLVSVSSVLKIIDDERTNLKSHLPAASLGESICLNSGIAILKELRERLEAL